MLTPSELVALLLARLPVRPDLRVAVVGSRRYPRMLYIRLFVRGLPPGTVVVSGHGGDVDQEAEKEARARVDLPEPSIFHARWMDRDGVFDPRAGFKRNPDIVGDAHATVAFWDLESRGTADSILLAHEAGTLAAVVGPKGEIVDDAAVRAERVLEGRKRR